MHPRLELRTTISPTPYFFRRIHFLAASLRALEQSIGRYEIVVSVGGGTGDENYYRTQPWSKAYPLLWRQVHPDVYSRLGYQATNRDRAWHMSRADYIMNVDADIIFVRDFSSLLDELDAFPAIAGVMAHISPFSARPVLTPAFENRVAPDDTQAAYWRLLGDHFGVELPLVYPFSGWGFMNSDPNFRYAPAYFNGGMVLGPAAYMEQMYRHYEPAEIAVNDVMETYFRPQLARTLITYKLGIPYRVLPVRYNFPNDPGFDAAWPEELDAVSILHYLRTAVVHRDENFADPSGIRSLVARTDLTGSNEVLRRRVEALYQQVLEEEQAA